MGSVSGTQTVVSRDGTRIAFERSGEGAPVILVDGALCYRAFGPSREVAAKLAERFTVYTYDRRGRGESGDAAVYSVEREIEDLDTLIGAAGGAARLCGFSSGAALALEAAARLSGVAKVAMFEAPFIIDNSRPPVTDEYMTTLRAHLAARRNGAAVKRFMRLVGVPAFGIFMMQFLPMWRKLKAVAPTLVYDATIMDRYQRGQPLPADRWRTVSMPALVMVGGKSPDWMQHAMRGLTDLLPHATHEVLPGQTHMVKADVLAPVVTRFFTR